MLGNISGFTTLVKKEAPRVMATIPIYRHALATKTLPTALKKVLSTVTKANNFMSGRSLNHCIFKTFC
jgi:hypothetical protein